MSNLYDDYNAKLIKIERRFRDLKPKQDILISEGYGFMKVEGVWTLVYEGRPLTSCPLVIRLSFANFVSKIERIILDTNNAFDQRLETAINRLDAFLKEKA